MRADVAGLPGAASTVMFWILVGALDCGVAITSQGGGEKDGRWILDPSLVGSKPGVVPSLCFFRRVRLAHSTFTAQGNGCRSSGWLGVHSRPLRKNNAAVVHSFNSTRRST